MVYGSRMNKRPIEGIGTKTLRKLGLTVVHPFFGEEERLKLLMNNWAEWSVDVKQHVNLILVDDHGTPSIEDLLTPAFRNSCDLNLSVYRILDDLSWNTPGALNLGFMTAATPWILTMDSDCTFDAATMQRLLDFKPDKQDVYSFQRLRVSKDETLVENQRVLPCTILIHKDTFLNVNGFDEDFTGAWSGGYGIFDNSFWQSCVDAGYNSVRQPGYVATEWMTDVCGGTPAQDLAGYDARSFNKKIWRCKQRGEKTTEMEPYDFTLGHSKKMLRFRWEQVFTSTARGVELPDDRGIYMYAGAKTPDIIVGESVLLTEREACFLYDTPKRLGDGQYVELGTYRGGSTLCLAGGMKDARVNAHLTTIDTHDQSNLDPVQVRDLGSPEVMQQFVIDLCKNKGVGEYVTVVRGDTSTTAKDYQDMEITFLFIDGDHSYEGCKADFEAWSPLVKSGGEVAFHDNNFPEVAAVINEIPWPKTNCKTITIMKKP